ncbi:unnamed protein product, partial [Gulo gulo]
MDATGRGLSGEHAAHGGDTCQRVLSEGSLALTKGEALNVIISKQINNKDNLKINKDL